MTPGISDTALTLITHLNNINDLIVIASDRNAAKDSMKAFKLYAQGKNVTVPEEKIEHFMSVLYDARPYTLTCILKEISEEILISEKRPKKSH